MNTRAFFTSALFSLGLLACGEGASLDVQLLNPTSVSTTAKNPFEGVTELEFKVFDADGDRKIQMEARASYESGNVSLENIPTGRDLKIRAMAYSGASVISWGESNRFRLPEGASDETVTATIVLRRVDSWSPVMTLDENGTPVEAKLTKARAAHTATRLKDGRVLLVGGFMEKESEPAILNSVEILDPDSGERTRVGDDEGRATRAWHTATKLSDGKVLVAGGRSFVSSANSGSVPVMRKDMSAFDPDALTWSDLGNMKSARSAHTSLAFTKDNAVSHILFFGGYGDQSLGTLTSSPVAELYTPSTNTLGQLSSPNPRLGHVALSLANGAYAAILGGSKTDGSADGSLLIYSPSDNMTGPFRSADKSIHRSFPAAVQYGDSIFLMGGRTSDGVALSSTQLIPLNSSAPSGTTPSLLEARDRLCAEELLTKEIIAAGGRTSALNASSRVDLFAPASDGGIARVMTANMAFPRDLHTCTLLENGQFLVTGGIGQDGKAMDSMEIYTPKPIPYPSW